MRVIDIGVSESRSFDTFLSFRHSLLWIEGFSERKVFTIHNDVNEKKIFVSNWHYDQLCDLVHTYVGELKFIFQIGTVIFPMLLTNAFHFTNLFLVFVITLFPSVT